MLTNGHKSIPDVEMNGEEDKLGISDLRLLWAGLAAGCLIGLLAFIAHENPPANVETFGSGVVAATGVSPEGRDIVPRAKQQSQEEAVGLAEAEMYFDKNIDRLRLLWLYEIPKALSKRRELAPDADNAVNYAHDKRIEYRQSTNEVGERFHSLPFEVKKSYGAGRKTIRPLRTASVYLEALANQDSTGSSTVAALTMDLLTNSMQFEVLRSDLAATERMVTQNEELASQIEGITTAEALIAMLPEIAKRHDVLADQMLSDMNLVPEYNRFLDGQLRTDIFWDVMKAYRDSWNEELIPLRKEAQTIQLTMRRILEQLPDSPRKTHLATQLAEALAAMREQK
jgi:hypothetical protein